MSTERPGGALRSWLFVPGDSERKQAKALTTQADALILDLEDSVDPGQLPAARNRVCALLAAHPAGSGPQLWVRINPPYGRAWRDDLAALFGERAPEGIVLPKVSAAAQIVEVGEQLTALEAARGLSGGTTGLLVIATETPRGLLALPGYPAALEGANVAAVRLAGLTWGAEDLSAALGARAKRDAAGALTFTYALARSSCLLAAAALGVQAIDGVHVEFRDAAGLARELEEARRDGFSGKLAIHPDQVAPINAAFTPTEAERTYALRVVAAFAATGGAGVASLDGQMIDRPHLLQARRVLAAIRGPRKS
ncbi:MAG TPA: CoA ester lyase [Candidatus Dormibacteraeota bacterium]|nr:CoA ester lyase [Candidatus Dormibacteraeota bacterium]